MTAHSTDPRDLTGARWSSAAICPRRAVYEGLDYPTEPLTEEQLSIFRRGRFIGAAIAHDIDCALEDADRPKGIAELEVPWGLDWIGHADYLILDDPEIIEVVSTAGCELPQHKVVQAAGYAVFAEVPKARVLSIDPSTFREQPYPVDVARMEEVVRRLEAMVVAGVRDGELPRRALRRDGIEEVEGPNEWPCRDCPFVPSCWKEWEPWPTAELPGSLETKVLRLVELENICAVRKEGAAPEAYAERAVLREELRARMVAGDRYRLGNVTLHFVEMPAVRRFSLADFERAGHALEGMAAEFVTASGAHERWYVRVREDAPEQ